MLTLEGDIEVVAEAARGDEVRQATLEHHPDVVLLDIEMPGMDGLSVLEQLRHELPESRILILTTFGRPGYLRKAMENGASGFLLKDAPSRDLAIAIRRAMNGERVALAPVDRRRTRRRSSRVVQSRRSHSSSAPGLANTHHPSIIPSLGL